MQADYLISNLGGGIWGHFGCFHPRQTHWQYWYFWVVQYQHVLYMQDLTTFYIFWDLQSISLLRWGPTEANHKRTYASQWFHKKNCAAHPQTFLNSSAQKSLRDLPISTKGSCLWSFCLPSIFKITQKVSLVFILCNYTLASQFLSPLALESMFPSGGMLSHLLCLHSVQGPVDLSKNCKSPCTVGIGVCLGPNWAADICLYLSNSLEIAALDG